jgi:hypothetical protein
MSRRSPDLAGRLTPRLLAGAWKLRRWQVIQPDGTRTEPFGAKAQGLLLYTADGWMSASLMSAGRRPLSSSNPRRAPAAERAAAFDSYFNYAGRWRLAGPRTVVHEVTVALNPATVGTLQWREARLSGRTLTLSAAEQTDTGVRQHRLVWSRPPAARARKEPA